MIYNGDFLSHLHLAPPLKVPTLKFCRDLWQQSPWVLIAWSDI